MSVFDVGLAIFASLGVIVAAIGIIIWHAYKDWQKELT